MANLNPTPSTPRQTESIGISYEVQSELAAIRHVVGLAAFAVEARRVLNEIDMVAESMSDVNAALRRIDSRCQWSEMPDMTATVLGDVHDRIEALLVGGR